MDKRRYECIDCESVISTSKALEGCRCPICKSGRLLPIPPPKAISVNVSVKDTEEFKSIINIFGKLLTDQRISIKIRQEYIAKIFNIKGC